MLPPGGPVNPAKRTLSAASAVQFVRSHAQVNYPNLVALVRVAASPEFMLNGVGASPRGRVFASFPRWTSLAAPSVMEAMPDGSFQTYPGRSIAHRECDSQDGQGPEDRNPGRRPASVSPTSLRSGPTVGSISPARRLTACRSSTPASQGFGCLSKCSGSRSDFVRASAFTVPRTGSAPRPG